ncbi:DUF3078 domain-containing protein [Robertkochia sediminum]|uniref:DUF3078 domain-containing protein n=1 Tax=Robertkochia sediminum TaxID=2785326 RepID=UPI0019326863|nr:DUF3078 domain-containing protein [Robertkochia sediminum]MBL7471865.1 DUF3078 domain-containing protein [Robertkochia sediminum]
MKYWNVVLLFMFCSPLIAQTDKEILGDPALPQHKMVIEKDTVDMEEILINFTPAPPKWSKSNKLGFDLSEIAFVNWNAGGNNAITTLLRAEFKRKYKHRNVQWANDLVLRYGINVQEGQKIRKTDDAIQLNSTFGARHDAFSQWYLSAKGNFSTQFSNGYKYPDRDTPISRFMAPGYFFLGVGAEYSPEGKDFTLYLSPLTQKSTFVLDQRLADAGSFGVRPAAYDVVTGEKIRDGQMIFTEVGILITNAFQTKIMENMFLSNKLSLYTDYLNSFGNIDVNWIVDVELKVNEYVKATLGTHIIYDNDIKFSSVESPTGEVTPIGPRIQLKQLLGVGLTYDF